MDTSSVWPRFYEKKGTSTGGSPGTVPWQLAIISNLVKNGIGYADAMQMPEAKAVWLSTVFAINEGAKLDILSTDDEALIDSLPQVKAEPAKTQPPTA